MIVWNFTVKKIKKLKKSHDINTFSEPHFVCEWEEPGALTDDNDWRCAPTWLCCQNVSLTTSTFLQDWVQCGCWQYEVGDKIQGSDHALIWVSKTGLWLELPGENVNHYLIISRSNNLKKKTFFFVSKPTYFWDAPNYPGNIISAPGG